MPPIARLVLPWVLALVAGFGVGRWFGAEEAPAAASRHPAPPLAQPRAERAPPEPAARPARSAQAAQRPFQNACGQPRALAVVSAAVTSVELETSAEG